MRVKWARVTWRIGPISDPKKQRHGPTLDLRSLLRPFSSILDPHDTFSSIYIPFHVFFLFRCHFSLLHVIPETP